MYLHNTEVYLVYSMMLKRSFFIVYTPTHKQSIKLAIYTLNFKL